MISGAEGHWPSVPPALVERRWPSGAARRRRAPHDASQEHDDALRMNRVIGLGAEGGVREAMVDEVRAIFGSARSAVLRALQRP